MAASARLRYLHSAATKLVVEAPSTAAALEAELGKLATDSDIALPPSHRREVCGACSNILVVGLSCTMSMQNPTLKANLATKKRTVRKSSNQVGTGVVYKCKRCSHYTRLVVGQKPQRKAIRLEPSTMTTTPRNQKPQDAKDLPENAIAEAVHEQAVKTAASSQSPSVTAKAASNASSKQRAKARKHSGLQALLAKNKSSTTTSASTEFDLTDFMKSG